MALERRPRRSKASYRDNEATPAVQTDDTKELVTGNWTRAHLSEFWQFIHTIEDSTPQWKTLAKQLHRSAKELAELYERHKNILSLPKELGAEAFIASVLDTAESSSRKPPLKRKASTSSPQTRQKKQKQKESKDDDLDYEYEEAPSTPRSKRKKKPDNLDDEDAVASLLFLSTEPALQPTAPQSEENSSPITPKRSARVRKKRLTDTGEPIEVSAITAEVVGEEFGKDTGDLQPKMALLIEEDKGEPVTPTVAKAWSDDSSPIAAIIPTSTTPPTATVLHDTRSAPSKAMQAEIQILSTATSQSLFRRWCTYEWFYGEVDKAWFNSNPFKDSLTEMNFGVEFGRLPINQWRLLRTAMYTQFYKISGTRRFSPAFLKEEKEKLRNFRNSARQERARQQQAASTITELASSLGALKEESTAPSSTVVTTTAEENTDTKITVKSLASDEVLDLDEVASGNGASFTPKSSQPNSPSIATSPSRPFSPAPTSITTSGPSSPHRVTKSDDMEVEPANTAATSSTSVSSTRPLEVGTEVLALHPTSFELLPGVVVGPWNNNCYLVRFHVIYQDMGKEEQEMEEDSDTTIDGGDDELAKLEILEEEFSALAKAGYFTLINDYNKNRKWGIPLKFTTNVPPGKKNNLHKDLTNATANTANNTTVNNAIITDDMDVDIDINVDVAVHTPALTASTEISVPVPSETATTTTTATTAPTAPTTTDATTSPISTIITASATLAPASVDATRTAEEKNSNKIQKGSLFPGTVDPMEFYVSDRFVMKYGECGIYTQPPSAEPTATSGTSPQSSPFLSMLRSSALSPLQYQKHRDGDLDLGVFMKGNGHRGSPTKDPRRIDITTATATTVFPYEDIHTVYQLYSLLSRKENLLAELSSLNEQADNALAEGKENSLDFQLFYLWVYFALVKTNRKISEQLSLVRERQTEILSKYPQLRATHSASVPSSPTKRLHPSATASTPTITTIIPGDKKQIKQEEDEGGATSEDVSGEVDDGHSASSSSREDVTPASTPTATTTTTKHSTRKLLISDEVLTDISSTTTTGETNGANTTSSSSSVSSFGSNSFSSVGLGIGDNSWYSEISERSSNLSSSIFEKALLEFELEQKRAEIKRDPSDNMSDTNNTNSNNNNNNINTPTIDYLTKCLSLLTHINVLVSKRNDLTDAQKRLVLDNALRGLRPQHKENMKLFSDLKTVANQAVMGARSGSGASSGKGNSSE